MSTGVTSLGKNRVLFGNNGLYAVKVEKTPTPCVVTNELECATAAKIQGDDVLGLITAERQKPVLDGAIEAQNIEDAAVTLAKIDPNSSPLQVTSGGTGLTSVPEGRFLTGSTASALQIPGGVKLVTAGATPVLEISRELKIGSTTIRVQDDAYGRKSLFAVSAANVATNLVAPLLAKTSILNNMVDFSDTTASGTKASVQKSGGFPVDAFFAWALTSHHATLNRESVVSPGRQDVSHSGRIRFRGDTVSCEITGLGPGSYTVFAVLRDARGTCSDVASRTVSIP